MSGVDGIPELAEFFLGVKDTEFQFCLKQSIFTAISEPGPPSGTVDWRNRHFLAAAAPQQAERSARALGYMLFLS